MQTPTFQTSSVERAGWLPKRPLQEGGREEQGDSQPEAWALLNDPEQQVLRPYRGRSALQTFHLRLS